MANGAGLVGGSIAVIRIAVLVDRLFLLALIIGLIISAVMGDQFTAALIGPRAELSAATTGTRLLMLIGVVMALVILALLHALRDVVASVRSGDPFVAVNAGRLQRIGWSLLVLQLLDIPGALITRFYPGLGDAAPQVGVSPGGWMAVLMAFVLARVFSAGTAMRDELEGTI
jgi:hypothetical protein